MEHKNTPSFPIKVIDEDLGIVEHIITVFGIVDLGGDKSHLGSFTKTIAERGDKVLVLDSHNTMSGLSVIGKPLVLREVNRAGLPAEVQEKYPEATGGVWAKTQFLMDTPEGAGIFKRIKADALREWSYGYDALDYDYETIKEGGEGDATIRNLRTLRLYEYSPVPFGMNQATTTIGTKGTDEEKPWQAFLIEGEYCVYKLDADGNRTGSSLGCHSSEDEANGQIAALYASEKDKEVPDAEDKAVMKTESDGDHPASHYLVVEDSEKVTTWHLRVRDVDGELNHNLMGAAWAALHEGYRGNQYEGPNKDEALAKLKRLYEQEDMETPDDKFFRIFDVFGELKEMTDFGPRQRLGDVLQGSIHRTFTNLCDNWYVDGVLDREERIQLSSLIGDALDILSNGVPEDVATREVYGWYSTMGFVSVVDEEKAPAPEDLAAETPKEAGPVEPPTSDMLRVIDIELMELELMEV